MSTNTRSTQERTAVRPRYVSLGVDADGSHHVYRTVDESIHVVHCERGREHVEHIARRPVDEWMVFVDERRGWDERHYGVGLAEMAARAIQS